ncbi:hypothetical protein SORBI_3006G190150 [Sorghum bicolor]|uniref:Uncharacterized protein n=1 Tax=Sorghum bicolor TaxID=4558 RepID=A0A1Z5RF46_SORBI|nr:hypothetical protein SORBI_3006G190150 [Sorghum bicolor]
MRRFTTTTVGAVLALQKASNGSVRPPVCLCLSAALRRHSTVGSSQRSGIVPFQFQFPSRERLARQESADGRKAEPERRAPPSPSSRRSGIAILALAGPVVISALAVFSQLSLRCIRGEKYMVIRALFSFKNFYKI